MTKLLCKAYLILFIICSLLTGGVTVFADVSQADFYGIITISNNSTTQAVDVSTNVSGLNTASMITAGYLNSTANNCAIQNTSGANLVFMPGYGSSSWIVWAGNMTSNQISSAILYCKNVTGGKISYFPGTTGFAVPSSATLNIGNSGNLTVSGWFNSTSTGFLLNSGNYTVKGNGSGNLTASVNLASNLSYDGAGNYEAKAAGVVSPAGANMSIEAWFYLDALGVARTIVAAGDCSGTVFWLLRVTADNKIQWRAYNIAGTNYAYSWISTNNITAGSWYHIVATYNAGIATRTNIYINGVVWAGTDTGVGTNISQPNTFMVVGAERLGAAYIEYWGGDIDEVRVSNIARTLAEAVAAYGGGFGVTYTVDANTVSLWHFNEGVGNPLDAKGNNNLVNTGATWTGTTPVKQAFVSVSSPVISSENHTIMAYLDGGWLGIKIDSSTANTVAYGGNVTMSGASLITGDILYYCDSMEVWKSSAAVSAWAWEYDTIFHDSIGANDGTPSFRTTTSDADVTAVLTSFAPTSQPIAPAFAIGEGNPFLSGAISATGNFTSGNDTLTYPGEDIIHSISDATGTPYQLPSTFIATFLILATSMLASLFLKSNASASMFVKTAVNTIGYGAAVALQIYDWWMLIFFFIFEIAFWFAAAERK